MKTGMCVTLLALLTPVALSAADTPAPPAPPAGWLKGAPDDATRFDRLQTYLRGWDQPMWEVGHRYEAIHEALHRKNFDLAAYHWRKIRQTIDNAVLKNATRKAPAYTLLIDPLYDSTLAAFTAKDEKASWAAIEKVRVACQACHVATDHPFINDQPLFDLRAPHAH